MLTLVLADVSRNRMPFSRAIASPEIRFFLLNKRNFMGVFLMEKGVPVELKLTNLQVSQRI